MKKSIIYGIALALASGLTACDSWLDINDNPNVVQKEQLTTSDIFPGIEVAFMNIYGGTWNYMGAFQSWMYAQSGAVDQWGDISRGNVTNQTANSGYTSVYRDVLSNAKEIKEMAAEEEDWGTYLAAVVIRVVGLQMIVDAIGDAPYSEATDLTNQTPSYDSAADIYAGLIAELDEALANPIDQSKATCTNFLLGTGATGADWIKVANAVKLRLLMRECGVVNVQSQLASLIGQDNFPTSDVAWSLFVSEKYKSNPLWGQFTDTGNHAAWMQMNIASQKVYEAGNDARMQVYFNPNDAGEYVGWLSGCYPGNQFASGYKDLSDVSCANLHATDPIYLITVAEIEFFKAEYEARYGSAAAAKTHYENAIKASFSKTAGLDESGANSVIAAWPYDSSNLAKSIGIQKLIHLTGVNGFEGWCELRRLKYPAFGSATGDDIIPYTQDATIDMNVLEAGTIYTTAAAERSSQLPANTVVQRWITPSNSTDNNINHGAIVAITVPLFWAE